MLGLSQMKKPSHKVYCGQPFDQMETWGLPWQGNPKTAHGWIYTALSQNTLDRGAVCGVLLVWQPAHQWVNSCEQHKVVLSSVWSRKQKCNGKSHRLLRWGKKQKHSLKPLANVIAQQLDSKSCLQLWTAEVQGPVLASICMQAVGFDCLIYMKVRWGLFKT